MQAVAFPIDTQNMTEGHSSGGLGFGQSGDPSFTVTKGHSHAVAVAPSLTATNDPSRSPQSSEVTQQVAAVHASTMTVRRLTPVECERLQGFPDNWTLIPWRKKPAEECPDGPRYKALGNSMACNCMAWIGERIAAWEAAR
jgi:DNA (cytosine-5)-methyltransferase 1